MERSKAVLWIVVVLASVFVIYWVGIRPPVDGSVRGAPDASVVGEPNAPTDANAPADPNAPKKPDKTVEPNEPADANAPVDLNAPVDPNKPVEPNEPMESLNFKGVEMKNVMEKLARWTGKTIIPSDDAMKVKLTIYAPDKLPRSKALAMIYSALKMNNFTAEETEDTIFLKSSEDSLLGRVPVVAAEEELASILNKEQIVQKIFQLDNYSAQQMSSVIQPMIGEHGSITADENAGSLLVTDTVSNLMRLERIISQFDVPSAEQTVTKVFDIKYGDPSEIVQMLNILLAEGGSGGRSSRGSSYDRGRDPRYGGGRYYPRPNPQPVPNKGSSGGAPSIVVGTTRGPIILIAEPRRKWVIARASADDMIRIGEWIEKLDKEEPVASEYEIVNLRYADPGEVEDSVGDGFRDLPGTEFLPSILIQPLRQTKQVIVFGRKDLREIVKKMILEIDVPPGMFETKHFLLKYADPDQIKTMIEELFSETASSSSPYLRFGGYSSRNRSSSPSTDEVKVISYVTLKQVTVIASPERMEEVAKQIEEWDKPIDVESVRPRIIELKNSDPMEMADLLKKLFSEETSSRTSMLDLIFGRGGGESQAKIVGPLYGQLTFEYVPGTKKIIVISKIPEAYDVIEQLILDLDREEMGEIPEVIEIKYADVEDLSERLNAMFVSAGQQARIRLTTQGLSQASAMDESSSSDSSSSDSSSNNAATDYTPPWSGSGARGQLDENMPISNVIGRIRFVPEPHTKSIMVLAPPEFMDEIRELIDLLDVPGKQVLIQAIIVEVEHTKMTSLGVKFATDPSAFGTPGENAMVALSNLTSIGTRGGAAGTIAATVDTSDTSAGIGATGSGTVFGIGTDVYALVDFLVKNTDARILNQQSLWTKDNEEASFFKGTMVPFLESATTLYTTTGGSTQNITYEPVGMELRVRPSITPENKVDMIVNVQISQVTSEILLNQPVRSKMETTTNMIVEDGQSLLLGGILFQKDSLVKTKIPGLGDIPLVGGLFRHKAIVQSNSELLVFMTPRVIDEKMEDISDVTRAAIEGPREKLEKIIGDLNTALEGLDQ